MTRTSIVLRSLLIFIFSVSVLTFPTIVKQTCARAANNGGKCGAPANASNKNNATLHTTPVSRVTLTPDLTQSSVTAALPWGGLAHCGPVAASNSLVYLARTGFGELAKGDPSREITQADLAQTLGRYMNTSKSEGTTVTGFIIGLRDYIEDRGCNSKILCQGWEDCPAFAFQGKQPDFAFIKRGVATANTAAWIKIGWYRYFPQRNAYMRFAGHWVTVVDVSENVTRGSTKRSQVITIHDPAPRSGSNFASESVTLSEIKSGSLITGYTNSPSSAARMLQLRGQLKLKEKADCGLIDDVVILEQLCRK